jgi:hypothetical protein
MKITQPALISLIAVLLFAPTFAEAITNAGNFGGASGGVVIGGTGTNSGVAIGTGYVGTLAPTNGMIVQGDVGIGMTNPSYPLVISATAGYGEDISINTNSVQSGLELSNNSSGSGAAIAINLGNDTSGYSGIIQLNSHENTGGCGTDCFAVNAAFGPLALYAGSGKLVQVPANELFVGSNGFVVGSSYGGNTAPTNGAIIQGNVAIGTTATATGVGFDVQDRVNRFGPTSYPANYAPTCTSCTYLVLDMNATNNDASVVFRDTGNARAEVGLDGDDNLHFKTVSGTYGSESFVDRILIVNDGSSNTGNVGIATTIPNFLLQVHTGTNHNFSVNDNPTAVHIFGYNDAYGTGTSYADLGIGASGNQLYLPSGGQVLVSYSSFQSPCTGCVLQVNGTIAATVTAITHISDKRLKKDIAPLGSTLPIIMALNPVSFEFPKNQLTPAGAKLAAEQKATPWKFKSEAGVLQPKPDVYNFPDGTQIGFVAQDVAEAAKDKPYLSALVDVPANPNSDYYMMREGNMIPLLVKAVQELKTANDKLETQLSADEATIATMKTKLGIKIPTPTNLPPSH